MRKLHALPTSLPPRGGEKGNNNMYDDRRRSGGFDRPPRELHDATCADCGQQTKVPFKPDGARPVYCRDCYAKRKPQRY